MVETYIIFLLRKVRSFNLGVLYSLRNYLAPLLVNRFWSIILYVLYWDVIIKDLASRTQITFSTQNHQYYIWLKFNKLILLNIKVCSIVQSLSNSILCHKSVQSAELWINLLRSSFCIAELYRILIYRYICCCCFLCCRLFCFIFKSNIIIIVIWK
jgi:hypothetical protein